MRTLESAVQLAIFGQRPSSRNRAAASGSCARLRAAAAMSSATYQSTRKPSCASFTAGRTRSFHGRLP